MDYSEKKNQTMSHGKNKCVVKALIYVCMRYNVQQDAVRILVKRQIRWGFLN